MEIVIDYILEALVAVLETYILYRYMTIFFDNNYIDKRLKVVVYVIAGFYSFLLNIVAVSPIVSIILSITRTFFVTLTYVSKGSKKLIVTIIIYMCGFMAEAIVALIVGISGFDIFGTTVQVGILYQVIIEFIFWMITLGIQRFKNIGQNSSIPKVFMIAIIIISFSYISLEVVIFQQQNINRNLTTISLVCVMCSVFIMLYLYDSILNMFRERTQAAIIEKEKDYYHEQSELLMQKYEEVGRFRHDIKNRMIVIRQMLKNNSMAEVLEYTEQLTNRFSEIEMYSDTGNLAIDSIINYKLTKAVEIGVMVKSHIAIPQNIIMDEDDIVVILGNVLDNAIEATERLTNEKYIHLDLEYGKGCMFIHIRNNYDSVVLCQNEKYVTRKKNKELHGIGLLSVSRIVEKYNGVMEIEHEGQEFRVDILLYI